MDFKKKVEKYIKEEQKLLEKNKIERMPVIVFRQKKIPLTAKFASWILRKHGAIIDWQFFDKTKMKGK